MNPMRPAETVGEFSASTEADAAAAVAAAAEAPSPRWAALPLARRAAYLVAAAACSRRAPSRSRAT